MLPKSKLNYGIRQSDFFQTVVPLANHARLGVQKMHHFKFDNL